MIIAVTGANGFIGRHLCVALSNAGYEVRPILRADFENRRLPQCLRAVNVVVHGAALTRAPSANELHQVNVDLTRCVIDACRQTAVDRLVLISSQAAAGPAKSRHEPVTEEQEARPVEEYGRSKLASERLVVESGLPFVVVRPAAVFGEGDKDFAMLFRLARHGVALHPGNRGQWVSVIHVSDCVRGIIAAATHPVAAGRTYFLANDEPVQWSQLFNMAAAASGRALAIDLEIPGVVVVIGARFGDALARITGRAGLLTTEKTRLARDEFWICSSQRAKLEVGFTPRLSLAKAIELTVQAHRR